MRQYFESPLGDCLIVPQSAVSPATSLTSLFSTAQITKYLALPFGQNAPSPGQVFEIQCGGLFTSTAGTFIFTIYHGVGGSASGTLLATSATGVALAAYTAGSFRFHGHLVYRSVSETATTSTAWVSGIMVLSPPAASTAVSTIIGISSAAAVSVDTTGVANLSGGITIAVTPSVTASSFTPEWAYIKSAN